MMRRLIFSMIILLCLPIQASYAVLYQWTDENGVKHFSTAPPLRQYEVKATTEYNPDTTPHKFAQFIRISAGRFLMGSPPGEEGRDPVREKQHQIAISEDFYMMSTEVTRKMWERVMGHKYWRNTECDKCPAAGLRIDRILYFIKQLNLEEGSDIYRLPTEEEWEYACRAGSKTPFYTGNCLLSYHANFYRTNPPYGNCQAEELNRRKVKKIGSYHANAWGLFDMHGNVVEICTTKDPAKKTKYITKGGSFKDRAHRCRSAASGTFNHKTPDDTVGFRLVRVIR